MFKALFLMVSIYGVSGSVDVVETVLPPHPCQTHSCENESVLTITSPYGISNFDLVAQQLGMPVSENNLVSGLVRNFNLSATSTDLDFMMAVALFFNMNLHTSWDIPETNSGIVHDPVYSLLNFTSTQCGDFVSTGIILINKLRYALDLTPIALRKAWLNGHTVMEYFDSQHQKWVFFDLDGAGGHLLLVSDGQGFYASIEEIMNNPSLILGNEGVIFLHEQDGLGANCIKNIFYENANSLFESVVYTEVLNTIPPLLRTGITIDENAIVKFKDRTGDYWWFDTTNLVSILNEICDSAEMNILHSLGQDSACGIDASIPCFYEGVATVNGFTSLNDLLEFIQNSGYYAYEMGEPYYKKAFRGHAESFTITLKPGEYDSLSNFYVGYLVKKLTPENVGIDYSFNHKTYNDSFEINKYMDRDAESWDSTFRNPQNLINEVAYAASIPSALGSLSVEFYLNYHTFAFMDTIQRIFVDKGRIEIDQTFKNDLMTTLTNAMEHEENGVILPLLTLYPNPTSNIVHIEYDGIATQVFIYDLAGRLILQSKETKLVDIGNLVEGLYFLNLQTDKGVLTAKIEKKH